MLELKLFKRDRDIIRKSEGRRFAEVELVDEIIKLYEERNICQFDLDQLRKDRKKISEEVSKLLRDGQDATCRIKDAEEIKRLITEKEAEVKKLWKELCEKQKKIGNIVDDSVPVSKSEADNKIVRPWGVKREEADLKDHAELVKCLGFADLDNGAKVAGARGYYLEGNGVLLNQALINFGLCFLSKKGYKLVQTPFFMEKDIMANCAQLAEFDEALYKVTGDGNDKYLIATAEQPMCAYHMNTTIQPSQLPLKYVAYSSCFRKEAGSVGRDSNGIFRVHQFEKLEQFCVTGPEDSWDMHDKMIKNSEEFYQMLGLPYQVVNVVSGELNLAAAKKYDLEAWFPASRTYRELVSCSNCTDYQSRKLEIRYGQKKCNKEETQYCHLLNSTLTATERTICCILENYQKEGGVEVPKVLQPYMAGQTFLPFLKKTQGKKKSKA